MIDGVHGGHIGQQGLRRTDIGSRFFPFDMLFPRLQGHAQCTVALGVDAHSDDSAGN